MSPLSSTTIFWRKSLWAIATDAFSGHGRRDSCKFVGSRRRGAGDPPLLALAFTCLMTM